MSQPAVWLFESETGVSYPSDYLMLVVRHNGVYVGITFDGASASDTRLRNEVNAIKRQFASTGWERIA